MAFQRITSKEFWRVFGILTGIFAFFFLTLILMTVLSRKAWENGLRASVNLVLEDKQPDTWIVGNSIKINSAFSTCANIYEIQKKDTAEKYYAVIIRSATLYGHIPAVFIYNKKTGTDFVGYASVKGRIKTLLNEKYSDSSIAFWTYRIPFMIQSSLEVNK